MLSPNKKWLWLIGGLLLLGGIAAVYFYYQRNSSNRDTFVNPKIAVIPFTNLTPDTETNYLGLTFSDAISKYINSTANYEVMRVRPSKPNEELNQLLNDYYTKEKVDLVITGTYAVSPNEIEITAKLINTATKKTVFNKSFTVANKDISSIPRLVSASTVEALGLGGVNPISYIVNPEDVDEEAYRDYSKAVNLTYENKIAEAIGYLEKATQRAPKFYSGWTLLASMNRFMAAQETNPNIDYYQRGIEAAQKAKQINPNDPQAGIVLVGIYGEKGDLEGALKEFRNLPKNDLNKIGRLRAGEFITCYAGLLDEAAKFSEEIRRIAPKTNVFQPNLYYRGEYEEFKKAITPLVDEPNRSSFYLGLMALYQNEQPAIRKHFQDSVTFDGDTFSGQISQAIIAHLDGKTPEGLKILQKAENSVNAAKYFDGETSYYLVIGYAFLGEKNGAIRVFKKTVDNGFFCYPYFERDPMVDSLRDNPQYQEILATARQKHLRFMEIYYSEKPV